MTNADESILPTETFRDYKNIKNNNRFIVKGVLGKGELSALISEPGKFKSFVALHLGICVSGKRNFLGIKTKHMPVLISDLENNKPLIADRWKKMRKGLGIRKIDTPLYFLSRKRNADMMDPIWIKELLDTIKEKKIKLIIFDTLQRHGDYDENQSRDLNKIYMNLFRPITDLECTVLYLHHTPKSNPRTPRGSGDYKGQADNLMICKRKKNKVILVSDKRREGEFGNLEFEITFNEAEEIIKFSEGTFNRDNNSESVIQSDKSGFYDAILNILGTDSYRSAKIHEKLVEQNVAHTKNALRNALETLRQEKRILMKRVNKYYHYKLPPISNSVDLGNT